jgi:co-chaperonin GroES (HSP10)
MAVIQMRGAATADKTLLREIGDISDIEVLNDRILIAIYRHEGKTEGGIITDIGTTQKESDYQGKVGLVLKIGPLVNVEGKAQTRGAELKIGDWVVVNPSSGLSMHAGKHGSDRMLRMLVERDIHMRVKRPDCVW